MRTQGFKTLFIANVVQKKCGADTVVITQNQGPK
jgi:hypothetical protein